MDYGCFTTMRVDPLPDGSGVGVRGWARHVERLQRDSLALFGEAVSRDAMVAAVHETVAGVELPILVRLAHEPHPGGEVAAGTLTGDRNLPTRMGRLRPLSVSTRGVTASDRPLRVRATRHDRFRPGMKHTLTAPELAERDAAVAAGLDDAVLVTKDGLLSEGTTWSLVLGRADGLWVTPQADVLPSVTLALLGERVAIESRPVGPDDLQHFDRAAAVGSGRGVHRIASIDAWTAGGDVDELLSAYASIPLDAVF